MLPLSKSMIFLTMYSEFLVLWIPVNCIAYLSEKNYAIKRNYHFKGKYPILFSCLIRFLPYSVKGKKTNF